MLINTNKTVFLFKNLLVLLLLSVTAFYCALLSSKTVQGQTLSLSISPPLLEVIIKPGKDTIYQYKLYNHSDSVIIVPKLLEMDQNHKLKPVSTDENWISLVGQEMKFDKPFLMKPNEEKLVTLRINPPQNLMEKDYYRVLMFSTSPSNTQNTTQSNILENIGSVLLVSVTSSGNPKLEAKIARFEIPKIIDSFGPLNLNIDIENIGNIYFRPIGTISLNGFPASVNYDITPQVILAGETTTLNTVMSNNNNQLSENNKPNTLQLNGFFIGKYRIDLKFALNNTSIYIEKNTSFYAFPWKAMLLIIIVAGLVFIISRKTKYNRKRRVKYE